MSSLSRNILRTASRNLRQRAPICNTIKATGRFAPTSRLTQIRSTAPFSTTMIPRSDAVATPAAPKEFDNEIVDMASYVHNYKIDSELAVSALRKTTTSSLLILSSSL